MYILIETNEVFYSLEFVDLRIQSWDFNVYQFVYEKTVSLIFNKRTLYSQYLYDNVYMYVNKCERITYSCLCLCLYE